MPRNYRHIKQHEKEIKELREEGLTQREVGERFGLSREQIKDFFKRERKLEMEIKLMQDNIFTFNISFN